MTKDGIPLCHHVFPGETPDKSTFREVISDIKARFPIKRCIVVADRGLLSQKNLEVLGEAGLDYIVARPLRQNKVSQETIRAVAKTIKHQVRDWEDKKTPMGRPRPWQQYDLPKRRVAVEAFGQAPHSQRSSGVFRVAPT
jgi:transposase